MFGTPDDNFKLSVSEAKGRALTSDLIADDDLDSEDNDLHMAKSDLDLDDNDLNMANSDLESDERDLNTDNGLVLENFGLNIDNINQDTETSDPDITDLHSNVVDPIFGLNQAHKQKNMSIAEESQRKDTHTNTTGIKVEGSIRNSKSNFSEPLKPIHIKTQNNATNISNSASFHRHLSNTTGDVNFTSDVENATDTGYQSHKEMPSTTLPTTTLPSTTSEATTLPPTTQQPTLDNEDIMQSLGIHYVKNFINFLRHPSQKVAHKSHQYFVNALRFQPNL